MPTGHGFLSGIFVRFPGTCSMKLARGLTQPCSTMHCRAQFAKNPLEEELDSPSTTSRGKNKENKNSKTVVERKVTQTFLQLPVPYDVMDPDPNPQGTALVLLLSAGSGSGWAKMTQNKKKKVKECIVFNIVVDPYPHPNPVKNLGADLKCRGRSNEPCREACVMSFFISLHQHHV
jgi:hypothetical protein